MDFETCLRRQIERHPSMQPQDVVKLCFQAAFGSGHLLSDTDRALACLKEEFSETAAADEPLSEPVSDMVCRISLRAWKKRNLPLQWLLKIFSCPCCSAENAGERFAGYIQSAQKVLASVPAGFSRQEWDSYLKSYLAAGMPAVHHSRQYRDSEHPSYRIADSRFCRIFPVLEAAAGYQDCSRACVIALDGRAASGKTTAAMLLKTVLDADVIHMDDFFLPPELRSPERFNVPGGNIHHERFIKEVLPFLSRKEPFSYRIFDCGIMDYCGIREIGSSRFRIVEGSYSCHPVFGQYADVSVFSDISPAEQVERIRRRNGQEKLRVFQERWIPMEEEYFSCFRIEENADIVI